MVREDNQRVGQRLLLWVSWVLVCAGAGVAARTTGQFMNIMVLGFAFGAAQTLVLGRKPPRSSVDLRLLWVAVSTIGGMVGVALAVVASSIVYEHAVLLGNYAGRVTFAVVLWTMIGAGQWLVLRHSVPRAAWWVLASAAGGVAFGAADAVISIAVGGFPAEAEAAPYGAVAGACYGAVTGVVLAWLFPGVGATRPLWQAAIPIVGAALLVVRVTATRDVCNAEEQASLAEFPQYIDLRLTPRTDESGGCWVSYQLPDTPDSFDRVTSYFTEQFARHGWMLEPQGNRSQLGGQLSARRGDVRYSIFYTSYAYSIPPEPTIQLTIQVRAGPVPGYMQQPPLPNPDTLSASDGPGSAPTPDLRSVRTAPAPRELGSVVLPDDVDAIRAAFERLPPALAGYARAPQYERITPGQLRVGYGEERRMGRSRSAGPFLVITVTDQAQLPDFPSNLTGGHIVGQMGQWQSRGEGNHAGREGDLFWLRQDASMEAPDSAERFPVYTLLWGRIDSSWIFSISADSPANRDALLAAFVAGVKTGGQ